MKIALKTLKPNPFRDFDLYPIDDHQVERLDRSIGDLGFFSAITARPDGNGGHEIGAGHHRVEAARRRGLKDIEAVVGPYNDEEMVDIMTLENLTQRGYNAGSMLDSVAAHAKRLTYDIMLGEGAVPRRLGSQLSQTQTRITQDGPGINLIYESLNGFPIAERSAKKDTEIATQGEIEHALASLKSSGTMADIVAKSHQLVVAERQRRWDEAQEKLTAAERRRLSVEHAKRMREAADRARRERDSIEEQQRRKRIYDARCDRLFTKPLYATAYREAVTGELGQRFIPRDRQFEFAEKIVGEIAEAAMSAPAIRDWVGSYLRQAVEQQQQIDKAEREALLREDDIRRVQNLWDQLQSQMKAARKTLQAIVDAQASWKYGEALFPMDTDAVEGIAMIGRRFGDLQKKLGI